MNHAMRFQVLAEFPARLAAAIGVAELVAASSVREELGIGRTLRSDQLRVGGRVLPSPIPRVVIGLDPPIDARSLCAAWGIECPVAVSGDVHQRNWQIRIAGEELPDAYHRRIAVTPILVGRWEVELRLASRPAGGLPDVVAGASPAYDILERSADITRIEVTPAAARAAVIGGGHPDAQALIKSMASLHPVWRSGWEVATAAEFVVVYLGEQPIVGAALEYNGHDGQGCSAASRFCVIPDTQVGYAGSALLDVLEAVALGRGSKRLTLDESVFLHTATIPCLRHGYVVAPPYNGDADAKVWAERELRLVTG